MRYLVNIKNHTVHRLPVPDKCHVFDWKDKDWFREADHIPQTYRPCTHCLSAAKGAS